MPFAFKVQDHINHGLSIVGRKLGPKFDIYRNGAKIKSNLLVYLTPRHELAAVEFAKGSFVYEAMLSRKIKLDTGVFDFLRPGDQLQGKDPASRDEEAMNNERYTIVGLRLLHPNLAVRTDEACQIYRPQMTVGAGAQPPQYNYEFFKTALQLTFDPVAGVWQFEAQPPVGGHLTTAFCGITRIGVGSYDSGYDNPMATPATGWLASSQLFYGTGGVLVEIFEEDIIVDPDLNIYRVERNYFQNEAAFINQMYCTRLIR